MRSCSYSSTDRKGVPRQTLSPVPRQRRVTAGPRFAVLRSLRLSHLHLLHLPLALLAPFDGGKAIARTPQLPPEAAHHERILCPLGRSFGKVSLTRNINGHPSMLLRFKAVCRRLPRRATKGTARAKLTVDRQTLAPNSFLFQRIHKAGSDSRFDEIKKSPTKFAGAWFMQGVWVSLTALPVFAVSSSCPFSCIDALWKSRETVAEVSRLLL